MKFVVTPNLTYVSFARSTIPEIQHVPRINVFTDFTEGDEVYGSLSVPLVAALTTRKIRYFHLIIPGLSRNPNPSLTYLREHASWKEFLVHTPEELEAIFDDLCPETLRPCTRSCSSLECKEETNG